MNSNDIFQQEVTRIPQPKLFSLGFERIQIKENWIYPTFLYEHDDIWFGTSWDWRDSYLEIDLGRLFFFKDVLPRVIIIGTININDIPSIRSKSFEGYEKYFQTVFAEVGASFEERMSAFESEYPGAYERKTKIDETASSQEKQFRQEFLRHLGKQLKRTDIPCE
jgi:hypothetical protein